MAAQKAAWGFLLDQPEFSTALMGSAQTREPSQPSFARLWANFLSHDRWTAARRSFAMSFGAVSKRGMVAPWSVVKWNGSGIFHPILLAEW